MKIGKDKILHCVVNFALALTGVVSYWLAIGLCAGASIGKEVGDKMAKGSAWDWKDSALDLVADLIGMGFGLLIVFAVKGGF